MKNYQDKINNTTLLFVSDRDRKEVIEIFEDCNFKSFKVFKSFDELKDYIEDNLDTLDRENTLVIPDLNSGQGHLDKIDTPRLCARHGIKTLLRNWTALATLGDKKTFDILLRHHGVNTPNLFDPNVRTKSKYIVKPLYSEFSKGITNKSILGFSDLLCKYREYEDEYICQEVIEGREIECALIPSSHHPNKLVPVLREVTSNGKTEILTEDLVENGDYEFNYKIELDSKLLREIVEQTKKVQQVLKVPNAIRVDFRVDANGTPYVIDASPLLSLSKDNIIIGSLLATGASLKSAILYRIFI